MYRRQHADTLVAEEISHWMQSKDGEILTHKRPKQMEEERHSFIGTLFRATGFTSAAPNNVTNSNNVDEALRSSEVTDGVNPLYKSELAMQPRLSHVDIPSGQQKYRPLAYNLQREASVQGFNPVFGRPTISTNSQADNKNETTNDDTVAAVDYPTEYSRESVSKKYNLDSLSPMSEYARDESHLKGGFM
jgi:hypothetical protein